LALAHQRATGSNQSASTVAKVYIIWVASKMTMAGWEAEASSVSQFSLTVPSGFMGQCASHPHPQHLAAAAAVVAAVAH
jgi:hypothetical protein